MIQKTRNYLSLALDDYRAARLLLRQGLLAQGVALAATAVEKELKAVLGLKSIYTKKHLDTGLLATTIKNFPSLDGAIDPDFIKFLGRGFQLRYASIDGAGYGIVINQHRTLMALDSTIMTIDFGMRLKANEEAHPTPLRQAIVDKDPLILEDNIHLSDRKPEDFLSIPNKMLELKVGANLGTLMAKYETEGLNVIGSFCKKTNLDFGKKTIQLALG